MDKKMNKTPWLYTAYIVHIIQQQSHTCINNTDSNTIFPGDLSYISFQYNVDYTLL